MGYMNEPWVIVGGGLVLGCTVGALIWAAMQAGKK